MTPQAKVAPSLEQANFAFLVETIASNLHLHAVEVVTITASVLAALRSDDRTLLRSCRHLMGDNTKSMLLALKYGTEIGLSAALVVRLNVAYASVLDGKRDLMTLIMANGSGPTRSQLQANANWWRSAAAETLKAIALFDDAAKGSLNAVYAEDMRAVRHALKKAANGDESLIDPAGRIAAPKLKQRRQSPRLAVHRSGVLHLPAGAVQVRIEDMSREGLGISCTHPLAVGQVLQLTLDNGVIVEAIVATSRGSFYGLSLRTRLLEQDILSPALR